MTVQVKPYVNSKGTVVKGHTRTDQTERRVKHRGLSRLCFEVLKQYPGLHLTTEEIFAGVKRARPDWDIEQQQVSSSCWYLVSPRAEKGGRVGLGVFRPREGVYVYMPSPMAEGRGEVVVRDHRAGEYPVSADTLPAGYVRPQVRIKQPHTVTERVFEFIGMAGELLIIRDEDGQLYQARPLTIINP